MRLLSGMIAIPGPLGTWLVWVWMGAWGLLGWVRMGWGFSGMGGLGLRAGGRDWEGLRDWGDGVGVGLTVRFSV